MSSRLLSGYVKNNRRCASRASRFNGAIRHLSRNLNPCHDPPLLAPPAQKQERALASEAQATQTYLRIAYTMNATNSSGEDLKPAQQRAVRRCPLVATVEVTEPGAATPVLSARTSEFGLGGCYIDTLNALPEGMLVQLRILRDNGVFETNAKVVYSQGRFGMGLAFTDMTSDHRAILEGWLAEIVTQLRPTS